MGNILNRMLCLLLTLSFTFNAIAEIKENTLTSVQKRLGLLAVEIENPVEAQVPEQFFSGKPPRSFKTAQQRFIGLKGMQSRIKDIVNQRKLAKSLVPISIIDSGLDPLNDYALTIQDWKIRNGKVVGTGFDFLSDTPWGIPQLQDPWIYAIGAQGIDQLFRVHKPINKPITFLANLNESVMSAVLAGVQNDPELKNTFFAKMDSRNTNMIGLLRILSYQADTSALDQIAKTNGALSPQSSPLQLSEADSALFKFASTAWIMAPDSGLPDFMSTFELEKLKGFVRFQSVVKSVLNPDKPTKLSNQVSKTIDMVQTYFLGHHFEADRNNAEIASYSYAKLSEQLAFKKIGTQIYNPNYEFYLSLRKMKAIYPDLSWTQIIDRGLSIYSNLLDAIQADIRTRNDVSEVGKLANQKASIDQVKKFIFEGNKAKDIEEILKQIELTGRVPWIEGESSLYRKWAMRTKQPDMHREAEFHGTHVATTGEAYFKDAPPSSGYIAVQGRVGLGYIKGNIPVITSLVEKNVVALADWFTKPVVARAIFDMLANDGVIQTPEGIAALPKVSAVIDNIARFEETPANIAKIANFMANRFAMHLMQDSGTVGLELHWKLIRRFKMDAAMKIPIGNLSLGGEYQFPSRNAINDEPGEKLGSKLDYIFGEFQKYMIAETLSTVAKNTLYFMAAGNSNNVGDGTTQSNYPADLRPKWLEKYKASGDSQLPGEKMDNVAIVMSANEENRRSGFSNLVITDNAVFMARGENINAGAMAYSMYTSNNLIKARYPEIFRMQNYMGSLSKKDSRVNGAFRKMEYTSFEEFSMLASLISESISVTRNNLALTYNDQKAEISGTSMGSPEVAFYKLSKFAEKIQSRGIDYRKAYGKPGFRPQDMIEDLRSDSAMVEIGTKATVIPSLFDRQKYIDRTPKAKALIQLLNDTRESKILCLRFYDPK